jgi:DNA-binding NarL/FixJ family response regulator
LPVDNNKLEYWLILSFIVLSGSGLGLYLRINKKRKLKKLSVQERKIFVLLQQGATNQEISDECHIEISTVKSHLNSIFSKLKIKSRKEALNIKRI